MKQYLFNINNLKPQEAEKCLSQMTEQRKKYIASVSNPKRKAESIAGEWLVKKAVSEFFSLKEEEIVLERNEKGKPYIKDRDIFRSVSHSGDFVVVAVDIVPIGIDIEVIKPANLKIADKVCSESDKQFILTAQTDDEKLLNFLKIWTAKEAYFKMKGTGIVNLKKISYKDICAVHNFENNLIITTVK